MKELDIKALVNDQVIPLAKNVNTGKYQEILIAPDVLQSHTYELKIRATDVAGNISEVRSALKVSPMWISPKTDWLPTDYINITDWRRIMGNLCYLKELAEKLYPPIPWVNMSGAKEYSDLQDADEWNDVESNLENMMQYTYPAASGKMMSFYSNGPMIDYMELNRIEDAILRFYQCLTSQYDSLNVLAFTLGGDDFGD